jgi:SAM-dependent methyltransferase
MAWPRGAAVRSALVDEYDLPLLESTVDCALVVHGLEHADSPSDMLQELWRVLAPQGRVILVVPNRRGLWSASERTPFGSGRPFSRGQLASLLKEAQFSAVSWQHALFTPPFKGKGLPRVARYFEVAAGFAFTRFSGVIIVEAMKQVYAFTSGKRSRRLVQRFRPVLLPAPGATARGLLGSPADRKDGDM